jgi:hypothetical protein
MGVAVAAVLLLATVATGEVAAELKAAELKDKVEHALADLDKEELAMEDLPNKNLDASPHDIAEAKASVEGQDNDIIDDWVNFMHDYEANTLVQFHLKARTTQVFYEEAKAGQLLRGAYFASADEVGADISFTIISPHYDTLVERSGTEAVFHVQAKEDGHYKFEFENSVFFQTKAVTFTVGVSDTPKLGTHTLDSTGEKINQMLHLANDAQTETHYMWSREATRLKHQQATHRRVVHFALLQFSVYALVTAFQLYYVKGLLSDRRVL